MIHKRNSRLQQSVLVLATGLLLAVPVTALASPNYPDVFLSVAQEKGSGPPCSPPCTTCHRDMNGGTGTAIRPFGQKFFQLALVSYKKGGQLSDKQARSIFRLMRDGSSTETPPNASALLKGMPTDVDMDGVSDFDELDSDTNPNPDGGKLCAVTYGCGARVEPHDDLSGVGALGGGAVAVALAVSLGRARKRRSTRR